MQKVIRAQQPTVSPELAQSVAALYDGGLPPVRYPADGPSPVGRRHARRPRCAETAILPGAPVLSRPRSPSRALRPTASASHAMALRATLNCDLARHTIAPVERMAKREHRPDGQTHPGASRPGKLTFGHVPLDASALPRRASW